MDTVGVAAVSVDGGPEREIDLHPFSYWTQFGRMLYDSGPLVRGVHTLKVRVMDKKNAYAKGCRLYADKMEVFY